MRSVRPMLASSVALVLALLAAQAAVAQSAGALVARESVGTLFFSEQQRGVLEAARQNVADFNPEDLAARTTTFAAPLEAPKLVLRSAIKAVVAEDSNSQQRSYEREQAISLDGLIGKTGEAPRLLIGGEFYGQEELQVLQDSLGLKIVVNNADDITAEDKLFKQKINFARGDVLQSDGALTNPTTEGRFIIVKRQ